MYVLNRLNYVIILFPLSNLSGMVYSLRAIQFASTRVIYEYGKGHLISWHETDLLKFSQENYITNWNLFVPHIKISINEKKNIIFFFLKQEPSLSYHLIHVNAILFLRTNVFWSVWWWIIKAIHELHFKERVEINSPLRTFTHQGCLWKMLVLNNFLRTNVNFGLGKKKKCCANSH